MNLVVNCFNIIAIIIIIIYYIWNQYSITIITATYLTLMISLLSGKAVCPFVWNPHITVS